MFGWLLGIFAWTIAGYAAQMEDVQYWVVGLGIGSGTFGFVVGTVVELKSIIESR